MASSRKLIDPAEMFFVLTNDGRLGMGYCPDPEAGGAHVIRWAPADMVKAAAERILFPKDRQ